MRIETKARRANSTIELTAVSSVGEPNAAQMVRLFGDRQPAEEFLDHICLPISLLNFEPFRSAKRPNGLSDNKEQRLQSRRETKRQQ